MGRQFWISVVVMFVLSFALGFVIHAVLLHNDYSGLPSLMRTEEDAKNYFGWMILAHLLMGFGITWVYRQGHVAGRPFIGQGLRFGAALAILITVPTYLIYYAVQPWPGQTVVKQICFDVVGMLVMGVVVAWLNQSPKST